MPEVQWLGPSRRDDDSVQTDTARLLNCYRERHGDKFVIKSVLGMTEFANIDAAFLRAMRAIGGVLYVVIGGDLYSVDSTGSAAYISTVGDGAETTLSGNNGSLVIAAGGTLYNVTSAGAVSTPALSEITEAGSASFIGQRTVVTEKNGRQIQWSDVADSSTFDALNFATAESRDDNIIRGLPIGGQFWVFGERSIERWYLTGSADESSAFAPISGSTIDTGLKAFGLLAEFPNGAFFIGNDSIVYLVSGGQLRPVSSRGVETAVTVNDADRCFYYEDEGHKFCVITFRDRPAWVYDVSNNEWHERAEDATFGPWSAVAAAEVYGASIVGTETGGVYKLERTNRDAGQPLYRRGISQTLEMEGKRFSIDRLQIRPITGVVGVEDPAPEVFSAGGNSIIDCGDGSALRLGTGQVLRGPEIMLRTSGDRARTWGKERWRDAGAPGDYDKVVSLRALGQFRAATLEFTLTDPVDVPIESTAFLDVS